MPGGLYTKEHAARILESIARGESKLYQPSNGTEGDMFAELWCEQCKHDGDHSGVDGCELIVRSLFCDVDDDDYPREWTFDSHGQPCCTRFEPDVK